MAESTGELARERGCSHQAFEFSRPRGARHRCEQRRKWGAPALLASLPLIFNPYSRDAFEPPKVLFFRLSVGLLALPFLLERTATSRERKPVDVGRLHPPVAVYATVQVLATVVSIDPRLSFWGAADGHGTLTLLCLVGLYFILSFSLASRDETARRVDAVLLSTIPVGLYVCSTWGWIRSPGSRIRSLRSCRQWDVPISSEPTWR